MNQQKNNSHLTPLNLRYLKYTCSVIEKNKASFSLSSLKTFTFNGVIYF